VTASPYRALVDWRRRTGLNCWELYGRCGFATDFAYSSGDWWGARTGGGCRWLCNGVAGGVADRLSGHPEIAAGRVCLFTAGACVSAVAVL